MRIVYLALLPPLLVAACSGHDNAPSRQASATSLPEPATAPHPKPEASALAASPLPRGRTLRDVTPELERRAEAGEARAACQLAREMDFCAATERNAKYLADVAARIRATPSDQLASEKNRTDVLGTLADLASVRAEYCEGMSEVPASDRVKLWREAALKGHLPSMLQYGSGLAFGNDQTLAALEELATYRRIGVGIMEQAAERGSLDAAIMLGRAYSPQMSGPDRSPLLRQAAKKSATESVAYYMLAEQIRADSMVEQPNALSIQTALAGVKETLSPAEIAVAEQRFTELRAKLRRDSGGQLDVVALNERESQQVVPGTEFCD